MQLSKRYRIHLTASSKFGDALNQPCVSLEEAGIEESRFQPDHGRDSVPSIVEWWSDGDDSRYCDN